MKNNVYPCKPQFYYIKVGFKGVKIIKACFRDARGLISLPCPHEETLRPCLSKIRPVKILISLHIQAG